ncbi:MULTISPECIES: membrane protein insertase YidC [Microbacterium]|uniref:membrane protein insertase YidC n=1 Tax=Microbacterium TaxID=33882 RepID=UPI000C481DE1|nr:MULTISPECIES: membrane protein insertase YidC [Microbacterium]MAM53832.1 membrane protein insertase YidC [Microbacterium sp.]HAS32506.1 membrane protein insertase YidC [Microbacterium sp.]|tara:strand:+ start:3017 stop:4126 length:1110 start_codon:yes stop_codon:yes gene_type:complete
MDLLSFASSATETSGGGGFDLIGTILWPLKWLVELVLVAWHWLFTAMGLPAAEGLTWVLSIVGLVIVVRSAMIPLFVRQIKSQRKMMEIAPELRKVQEKYKGKRDQLSREAMSRETMALYKKHGTTPVSSCLPLLVQMPVFFALFSVLNDVTRHAQAGIGGVGLLNAELTQEFYDAKLFGVASLHETLIDAINSGNTTAIIILVTLVVLMIASQFFTQLQIISKNLSPEAKTGQAYQMQKIMLYVLPFAFVFSGVFFPLGVVIYWFVSNLWTMGQQFLVIREMPTPGSDAAKAREERLARKGKAIDSSGKVVSMEKYQAEQQRLVEEAERAKAAQPKRQQPVGKQRAKKQAQKQSGPSGGNGPSGNAKS